jgi:acyl-CoA synthetase (AMP-forming)/AMP-acid ligase II
MRNPRVSARSRRFQGPDRRPGILRGHGRGARPGQCQAARHRLRRPRIPDGGNIPQRRRIGPTNLIAEGRSSEDFTWNRMPDDEWDAISLNYTSGTTGNPEGRCLSPSRRRPDVLRQHVIASGMTGNPVYLWTLPMFHCNGWCFPWTLVDLSREPMSACVGCAPRPCMRPSPTTASPICAVRRLSWRRCSTRQSLTSARVFPDGAAFNHRRSSAA